MSTTDQANGFRLISGTRLALLVAASGKWDEERKYGHTVAGGCVPKLVGP
jgi:hypothetical protein